MPVLLSPDVPVNLRAELGEALDVLAGQRIPQDPNNSNAWKNPIIEAVLPVLEKYAKLDLSD